MSYFGWLRRLWLCCCGYCFLSYDLLRFLLATGCLCYGRSLYSTFIAGAAIARALQCSRSDCISREFAKSKCWLFHIECIAWKIVLSCARRTFFRCCLPSLTCYLLPNKRKTSSKVWKWATVAIKFECFYGDYKVAAYKASTHIKRLDERQQLHCLPN